jgi:superfamily II DNA/RNA helicase
MFDMGFLPDVRRILGTLPKVRQNLFFSATMPKEIRGLADELQRGGTPVALFGGEEITGDEQGDRAFRTEVGAVHDRLGEG